MYFSYSFVSAFSVHHTTYYRSSLVYIFDVLFLHFWTMRGLEHVFFSDFFSHTKQLSTFRMWLHDFAYNKLTFPYEIWWQTGALSISFQWQIMDLLIFLFSLHKLQIKRFTRLTLLRKNSYIKPNVAFYTYQNGQFHKKRFRKKKTHLTNEHKDKTNVSNTARFSRYRFFGSVWCKEKLMSQRSVDFRWLSHTSFLIKRKCVSFDRGTMFFVAVTRHAHNNIGLRLYLIVLIESNFWCAICLEY